MKKNLNYLFYFILICMLIVTTWASSYESVFVGAEKIFKEPWAIATLADAYFGFLTFYVWVLIKEHTVAKKIIWLILILLLGNIAMSIYCLIQLRKWDGLKAQDLLCSKN